MKIKQIPISIYIDGEESLRIPSETSEYLLHGFQNHIVLNPGRGSRSSMKIGFVKLFQKNSGLKRDKQFLKTRTPSTINDNINKLKMHTHQEAGAGIEFNFSLLTYAKSKNNITIKSFYFKVNLFHQYHLLKLNERISP